MSGRVIADELMRDGTLRIVVASCNISRGIVYKLLIQEYDIATEHRANAARSLGRKCPMIPGTSTVFICILPVVPGV